MEYRTVSSPIGVLLLVGSDRHGVLRLGFETQGHQKVLDQVRAQLDETGRSNEELVENSAGLQIAVDELTAYFAGSLRAFTVPIDDRFARGFRYDVQQQLNQIDYGTTISYAEMAERLGRPQAVRAVGSGCAQNPVPLFRACHRVIRSDGTLGGYAGGLDAKRWLLNHERDRRSMD